MYIHISLPEQLLFSDSSFSPFLMPFVRDQYNIMAWRQLGTYCKYNILKEASTALRRLIMHEESHRSKGQNYRATRCVICIPHSTYVRCRCLVCALLFWEGEISYSTTGTLIEYMRLFPYSSLFAVQTCRAHSKPSLTHPERKYIGKAKRAVLRAPHTPLPL